jgi:hypothetical protein
MILKLKREEEKIMKQLIFTKKNTRSLAGIHHYLENHHQISQILAESQDF